MNATRAAQEEIPMTAFTASRRSLLQGAAVGAAALATPNVARANPVEIVIGTNGGAAYRGLYNQVLRHFEQRHNAKVVPVFGSGSELLNRVIAERARPAMDAVVVFQGAWLIGRAEGVFEKVDYSKIDYIDDIYDFLRDPEGYAPFVNFGAWGICYDSATIRRPPTSFKALWDRAYDRQVMVGGVFHWQIHLAAFAHAFTGDQKQIDVAFARMKELAPRLAGFYGLSSDAQSKVQQGIGSILPWYSYTAQRVRRLGIPLAFQMPEEGAFLYPSGYYPVKGTQKLDLVQKLIGTFYDPALAPGLAREDGWIPANRKVTLDAALQREILTADEVLRCHNWDWAFINANESDWLTRWNREIRPLVRG
jgi:putative spermidine/putrescine transport system substrate-binding protein